MTHKHEKAPGKATAKLEIVLKADSVGTVEAASAAISELFVPGIEISIIRMGVGDINKSDILLSETAGRLIAGFQVRVLPTLDKVLREHRVDVRIDDVIYNLVADIKAIAEGMVPPAFEEQIIGSAKVIALFKSTRKGIIIGCEVNAGFLAVGDNFRIISAMGPVYSGTIESLHIGQTAVQKATQGKQVGIKMRDFKKVTVGDLVESFRPLPREKMRIWQPRGEIMRR